MDDFSDGFPGYMDVKRLQFAFYSKSTRATPKIVHHNLSAEFKGISNGNPSFSVPVFQSITKIPADFMTDFPEKSEIQQTVNPNGYTYAKLKMR